MNAIRSSDDMCSILRSSWSRSSRIIRTESKRLSIFGIQHLPRRADFQGTMAKSQVDRVVALDTAQVHDVLEVPAHQDIHFGQRRDCDVLRVRGHPLRNYARSEVQPREMLTVR